MAQANRHIAFYMELPFTSTDIKIYVHLYLTEFHVCSVITFTIYICYWGRTLQLKLDAFCLSLCKYLPACVQFPTSPVHVFLVQVRCHSKSLDSQPITALFPSRLYHACVGRDSSGHPVTVNVD